MGWAASSKTVVRSVAPYHVRSPKRPQRYEGAAFGRAKYGLLISLDGVSYDSILRMIRQYPSKVPHFLQLLNRGFLRPLQVAFPSMTWSNHVSMVTGQYPRHHGVLGNRWLEDFFTLIYPYTTDIVENDRFVRTPALYDLASARGWKTAALNWPGTQRAKHIYYNLPEIMGSSALSYRYTSRALRRELLQMWWGEYRGTHYKHLPRQELKRLLGRIAAKERIETDMLMRDLAIRLVAPRRGRRRIPRLMMLHLLLPDSLLHKYGPSPWIERWGLEQMDRLIGQVILAYKRAKIWSKTATFMTSDHGFVRITHSLDIRQLLIKARVSKYRSLGRKNRRREKVMSFVNGHAAFIYIKPDYKETHTPRVHKALRDPRWRGCIEAVLTPKEYAKLGLPRVDHSDSDKLRVGIHAGSPTLIAVTRPHCLFRTNHGRRGILRSFRRYSYGAHGYFPHARQMWTFLLGAGPGVRRRGWRTLRKRRAYIVDIAPTLAHLMGLRWPRRWKGFGNLNFRLDGRILTDVLHNSDLGRRRKP